MPAQVLWEQPLNTSLLQGGQCRELFLMEVRSCRLCPEGENGEVWDGRGAQTPPLPSMSKRRALVLVQPRAVLSLAACTR